MNSDGHRDGEPQPAGRRCPFYGFEWPEATRLLLREPGNRCGLALDEAQVCRMEAVGRPPDMNRCPVAEELADFIRCASPVIAFVTPEHPDGVPYDAWVRQTMAGRGAGQGVATPNVAAADAFEDAGGGH